mgnify:CR=1 FL=1
MHAWRQVVFVPLMQPRSLVGLGFFVNKQNKQTDKQKIRWRTRTTNWRNWTDGGSKKVTTRLSNNFLNFQQTTSTIDNRQSTIDNRDREPPGLRVYYSSSASQSVSQSKVVILSHVLQVVYLYVVSVCIYSFHQSFSPVSLASLKLITVQLLSSIFDVKSILSTRNFRRRPRKSYHICQIS